MTRLLAGVALAALTTGSAFADAHEGPSADDVLATVNGVEITLGHLITMQTQLPEQYRQLPDEVLVEGLMEQLIQQQVLATAGEEGLRRIDELGIENERRALVAAALIDRIVAEGIDDETLQAEYDAIYGDTEGVTEWNASHILVETEEEAAEIVTLLDAGGDFAELAAARSIGPSGPNGGQLGWFGPNTMVAPFEAAVAELETGEFSGPVQTQFGWHVLFLNETRLQEPPSLESVRAELERDLIDEIVDARVEELREAAQIDRPEMNFDPAVIRNTDLLEE